MNPRFQTVMQMTRFFLAYFLCFVLSLSSGCGKRDLSTIPAAEQGLPTEVAPVFSPAEQADVDKYIREHGTDAMVHFMAEKAGYMTADTKRILKSLEYLITQGANINTKDNIGRTPLHYAAARSDISVVKFLVSKGAKVNATDRNGEYPYNAASKAERNPFARMNAEYLMDMMK